MENLYKWLFILNITKNNSVYLGLILSSVNNIILTIKYIVEILIITTVHIYTLNLFL